MKIHTKTLIALAGLLALGTASAQVSLSGRIDQSVVKSSPGKWELTHGSANRLIFKSEEDLGDGMKAYGYLQHRFLADTGVQRSGPFWYYAYAGIKGKFGDIRLGHQKSPLDDATGSDYEVWDGDTVASSYSRIAGGQKIWDNGVNYRSPSLAGFSINVGVAAGEGVAKTVRGQGLSLIYEMGGLSASLSTQRSPTDVRTDAVGGSFVTDKFRLLGTWATSTRVGGNKKQTDLQLSGGYQLTPDGELRVLYNRSKLVAATTELWSLGYFHFISKRTALYTAWSDTRAPNVEAVNAYQVGVRHAF